MTGRSAVDRFLPLTHLSYFLLLVLAEEPGHGYALVERIRERSKDLVNPGTGSFYTVVGHAVDQGLIAERPSPGRRRVYELTTLGGRVLAAEHARLTALAGDTRQVLARRLRKAGG